MGRSELTADTAAGTYISTRPILDVEMARAAALQVCGRAVDAAEARDLIEVLGLTEALMGGGL